ncbi:MAG: MFS transporter [Firmicutes bacterium HGW-Firmicutes-15]|nr:MAG: MFS transporter [Firmicutes bacterium HGW-Firmicutes-15]
MNVLTAAQARLAKDFPALTHQNFKYFWIGQCLSLLGTWMQRTAQQWLVYDMTKSPLLLGLLGAAQFGPVLFLSLFAGVLVDRYPKKKILFVTQTVLMLQAIIFALLVMTGYIRYWHILVLAAVMGFANTLDMPTRQSFIIELVGKRDLMSGIALNSAIVNLAKIIGPALAGLVITFLGTAACLFLNGLSFIAVLIGLFYIKTDFIAIRPKNGRVLDDVVEGIKYITANKMLGGAVLAMLAVGTFAFNSNIIMPVFAREVLHKQVSGYSFLLSAMGLGSFIAALVVSSRSNKGPNKQALFGSAIILCIFYMLLGLVHNYYMSLIILAIIGFFSVSFMTTVNTTIQLNSDDLHRGRAMSVYSLALMGTSPIGNLFAGGITEKLGSNAGFFTCGAIALLLLVPIMVGIRNRSTNSEKATLS